LIKSIATAATSHENGLNPVQSRSCLDDSTAMRKSSDEHYQGHLGHRANPWSRERLVEWHKQDLPLAFSSFFAEDPHARRVKTQDLRHLQLSSRVLDSPATGQLSNLLSRWCSCISEYELGFKLNKISFPTCTDGLWVTRRVLHRRGFLKVIPALDLN
jgi:hypothetical protein